MISSERERRRRRPVNRTRDREREEGKKVNDWRCFFVKS